MTTDCPRFSRPNILSLAASLCTLFGLVLSLSASANFAFAQAPDARRTSASGAFLWTLERDGRVSYAFGSDHGVSAAVLPPQVAEAVRSVRIFSPEVSPQSDINDNLKAALHSRNLRIVLPVGERLSRIVSSGTFNRLRNALRELPPEIIDQLRVETAIYLVVTEGAANRRGRADRPSRNSIDATTADGRFLLDTQSATSLDGELESLARAAGARIEELESLETRVHSLAGATVTTLLRLINGRLSPTRTPDESLRLAVEGRAGYLSGDLSRIQGAGDLEAPELSGLVHRHVNWINRIEALHAQGPVFFSAGLLHWVQGSTSLLNILRDRGFVVRRLLGSDSSQSCHHFFNRTR